MLAKSSPAVPLELPLLPPAQFGRTSQYQQILQLDRAGQRWEMQVLLRISDKQIRLLGLSPLGQRLLQIDYNGEQVESWQASEEMQLPAREILFQMQISLWPEKALVKWLADSHWQLQILPQSRQLFYQGKPWLAVNYVDGQKIIKLTRYQPGYQMTIISREEKRL